MKKYELTGETIRAINGTKLYRIRAINNFGGLRVGFPGGFIESEDNLSHDGNCWIYGDSQVYGDAWVSDNAVIDDEISISGKVVVTGNIRLTGRMTILGDGIISPKIWPG